MSTKLRQWLQSELKVIISFSLVLFALDTSGIIIHLYNDPFSIPVLSQALLVLGQSIMRALLSLIFPTVFNHDAKTINMVPHVVTTGTLPVDVTPQE